MKKTEIENVKERLEKQEKDGSNESSNHKEILGLFMAIFLEIPLIDHIYA